MKLFDLGFITVELKDLVDITLVAFILFRFYKLVKGSLAANILIGLIIVYLLWLLVDALNLKLLTGILNQFISLGVISLIIIFQPEIRRFLLMIGKNSFVKRKSFLGKFLVGYLPFDSAQSSFMEELKTALQKMSNSKTGALLVFAKTSGLQFFANTGTILDAKLTESLLLNLFNKNSNLHDGAAIIVDGRIKAAGCVLPVTENQDLPRHVGLRHRSAVGISEVSDAYVIVVSEETGLISVAKNGRLTINVAMETILQDLSNEFGVESKKVE